ncbi:MAG: hypothetical protein A2096_16615 [Spirochaetes bacterium GWF1_41_5]|nr:MAG: hypothetical protein A2096_16615 [Spirochaetes bacterium GWF1_41_5]
MKLLIIISIPFSLYFLFSDLTLSSTAFHITMDENCGKFYIKNNNGRPDTQNDDGKAILNNTTWPPTSYAEIYINDKLLSLGCTAGKKINSDIDNNSLFYTWEINKTQITQIISLQQPGKIRISYKISSAGGGSADIGIRLCLDLSVISSFAYVLPVFNRMIKSENIYYDINEWFCVNSAADYKIIMHFFIPGEISEPPEKIVFSSWENFSKSGWDIKADTNRRFGSRIPFSRDIDPALGIYWRSKNDKNPGVFAIDMELAPEEDKFEFIHHGSKYIIVNNPAAENSGATDNLRPEKSIITEKITIVQTNIVNEISFHNKVMILPFINNTGQTQYDFLKRTVASTISSRIAKNSKLEIIPLAIAEAEINKCNINLDSVNDFSALNSEIIKNFNCKYIIYGSITVINKNLRIIADIYKPGRGTISDSFSNDSGYGKELFISIDSIADMIIQYLNNQE